MGLTLLCLGDKPPFTFPNPFLSKPCAASSLGVMHEGKSNSDGPVGADKLLSWEPALDADPDPKSKSLFSTTGLQTGAFVGEGKGKDGELTSSVGEREEEGLSGNGYGIVGDLVSDQLPDPSESKLNLLCSSLLRFFNLSLPSKPFFLLGFVVGEDDLLPLNQVRISG